MKLFKSVIFILIVFFKTETLFSDNDLFNVNNIELEKKHKITNKTLADKAIKEGFSVLITKLLLKEDIDKLLDLNFSLIKELVTYYQITDIYEKSSGAEFIKFSVTFDKDKIHDLFYKKNVLYSEILDKELFILPILIKDDEIFVFNNNFFYENWNKVFKNDLIEFILPLENIEIIQNINNRKQNLINLDLASLFQEYSKKNIALIIIEDNQIGNNKIFIKSIIQNKKITKSLNFKKHGLEADKLYEKIIAESKKELINLVKSKNLIDIRTPSFLITKLRIDKKSNLATLNSRIKNIDLIENPFVLDFNKDYMNLRIKYLGKLEKIINQLKKENIDLKLINDQWVIKIL